MMKPHLHNLAFGLVRLVVPLVIGCAPGPHPRLPRYSVGFVNGTSQDLNEARAVWAVSGSKWEENVGILVPGAHKVNSEQPDPIPKCVSVRWRTSDGRDHRQTVAVAERVKDVAFFSGIIWLKITDSGVRVVPLTDEEMAQAKEMP